MKCSSNPQRIGWRWGGGGGDEGLYRIFAKLVISEKSKKFYEKHIMATFYGRFLPAAVGWYHNNVQFIDFNAQLIDFRCIFCYHSNLKGYQTVSFGANIKLLGKQGGVKPQKTKAS